MNLRLENKGLCRLLYKSRAVASTQEGDRAATPHEIAATSGESNRKAGLTGALLVVDDHFIQVLEGLSCDVEATFERICRDFRHRDIKLLDLLSIKERSFGDWDMALIAPGAETSLELCDELEDIRLMAGINARQAVAMMRAALDPARLSVHHP